MTRQNVIHKHIVMCEKYRKEFLKENQRRRKGGKAIRTFRNRKWFKQIDKDFNARWKKENEGRK